MAKILVTGGLGTLGDPLVAELRSRDHDVHVFDIPHREADNYHSGDVSSYRQLEAVFEVEKFDYVYHLAAVFGRWAGEQNYENLWETNAAGMRHLLDLQRKYSFRLIFFSSSEVYGDYEGEMEEPLPFKRGVRFYNDYGMTKWVNEQQIMNAEERHDVEAVRLRPTNIYGPPEEYSSYRSVVAIFCYHALTGQPYTVYTDHVRTFTFIGDFVRTAANVVDRFTPGEVYNISGEDQYTIKELSDTVLDMADGDESLVEYHHSDPETIVEKRVNNEKAKRDLDHEQRVDLEEGIRRTMEWMREYYDIENT